MSIDYLNIWIADNELKEYYKKAVEKHNKNLQTEFPNAGFDLFCPENSELNSNEIFCLDTNVVCSMMNQQNKYISYYLYPRSSIIKTPLRLANSVGIIDSGYRGNIKSVFDVKSEYNIEKYSRLVQICSPTLLPLYVKIVDNIEDLGVTERGSCGFGSTGK
jgi:dUTP pyrophosphatase